MGEKRHITVRIPEYLCLEIEARAIIEQVTFSQEVVILLAQAITPPHDGDLPAGYRLIRERARMEDRVTGHREIIRDLRHQLADAREKECLS